NPGGTPVEVFDRFRKALAANRAQLFLDVPSGTFYGFNRTGAKASRGNHPELVASGDDGQRTRSLRRHQGFLRDRPKRAILRRSVEVAEKARLTDKETLTSS